MADFEKRWSEAELFALSGAIKAAINQCKNTLNAYKVQADTATIADKTRLGLTQAQWDVLVQRKSDMVTILDKIENDLGY